METVPWYVKAEENMDHEKYTGRVQVVVACAFKPLIPAFGNWNRIKTKGKGNSLHMSALSDLE